MQNESQMTPNTPQNRGPSGAEWRPKQGKLASWSSVPPGIALRRGAWSTRPGRDYVASRAARCAGRAGAGFLEAEGAKRDWRRDRKGPKCWVVLACGTRL